MKASPCGAGDGGADQPDAVADIGIVPAGDVVDRRGGRGRPRAPAVGRDLCVDAKREHVGRRREKRDVGHEQRAVGKVDGLARLVHGVGRRDIGGCAPRGTAGVAHRGLEVNETAGKRRPRDGDAAGVGSAGKVVHGHPVFIEERGGGERLGDRDGRLPCVAAVNGAAHYNRGLVGRVVDEGEVVEVEIALRSDGGDRIGGTEKPAASGAGQLGNQRPRPSQPAVARQPVAAAHGGALGETSLLEGREQQLRVGGAAREVRLGLAALRQRERIGIVADPGVGRDAGIEDQRGDALVATDERIGTHGRRPGRGRTGTQSLPRRKMAGGKQVGVDAGRDCGPGRRAQ